MYQLHNKVGAPQFLCELSWHNECFLKKIIPLVEHTVLGERLTKARVVCDVGTSATFVTNFPEAVTEPTPSQMPAAVVQTSESFPVVEEVTKKRKREDEDDLEDFSPSKRQKTMDEEPAPPIVAPIDVVTSDTSIIHATDIPPNTEVHVESTAETPASNEHAPVLEEKQIVEPVTTTETSALPEPSTPLEPITPSLQTPSEAVEPDNMEVELSTEPSVPVEKLDQENSSNENSETVAVAQDIVKEEEEPDMNAGEDEGSVVDDEVVDTPVESEHEEGTNNAGDTELAESMQPDATPAGDGLDVDIGDDHMDEGQAVSLDPVLS